MAFRQYTEYDVSAFEIFEALLQILVNLREKNTPNSNKIAKFQKHQSQVTVNIKRTSKWDVTRLVHILHSISVFILNEN
jgi:hypothetical protein